MSKRKVSVSCVCAAFAIAVPTPAWAQIDPGVNYDPGSPAGKEYAIPLVEGRSDGAGTTNQRAGANIPFGVGIVTPSEARRQGADGRRGSGGRQGSREVQGARNGESTEELNARIRDAEMPAGTAARTFLLALAVLLPAGLLALLLRERPQPSRTGRAA